MKKMFILVLLAAGVTLSCDNPFSFGPLGPTQIKITVSGGTKPVISWKGGPVHFIAVLLADSLITEVSPDSSITKRNPIVWGFRAFSDEGKGIDGISSPAQFGSVISHSTDISDSVYKAAILTPGVKYHIRMSTTGPGSVGFIVYKP